MIRLGLFNSIKSINTVQLIDHWQFGLFNSKKYLSLGIGQYLNSPSIQCNLDLGLFQMKPLCINPGVILPNKIYNSFKKKNSSQQKDSLKKELFKLFSPQIAVNFQQTRNIYLQKVNLTESKGPKVYTRKGDGGSTTLFTGERRSKDDLFFTALGTIDELSSNIGLAKEFARENKHDYEEQLERIQCILQDIGTIIATPVPKMPKEKEEQRGIRLSERIRFNQRHVAELENWIDSYTETLPPLTNFILPGGGRVSAALHVCRSVCRRAERTIIPLMLNDFIDPKVLIYINRLSDYLFTVARHATILDGKKETIYIRPKPPKDGSKKEAKEEIKK